MTRPVPPIATPRATASGRWVLHDYLQVNGGAERLVIDLANGLEDFQLGVAGVYPDFSESGDCGARRPQVVAAAHQRLLPRVPRALAAFARPPHYLRRAQQVIYSGLYAPLAAPKQTHGKRIYYCHTPPRFAFDQRERYLARVPAVARPLLNLIIERYRAAYLNALQRMDLVVTNSRHVRERLLAYTGIAAEVVHPPIATETFRFIGQQGYYLSLARLEPNKRVERIVRAFLAMPDQQLVIASGGSQLPALKALANDAPNIRFTGWLDDAALKQLLGNAIAALYVPQDEDFGMSAVEAMAAGKPLIGVDEGGLRESVVHGSTGLLLPADPSVQNIVSAVRQMSSGLALSMRRACEARAVEFSRHRFINAFKQLIS